MRLLAGDIGGTNTRLVLAEIIDDHWHILFEQNYPSSRYSGLEQVLELFLTANSIDLPVDAACFAIAGPVNSGVVSVTNLPWVISESSLRDVLQTDRVVLINDFVAVGHGIPMLEQADILLLQQGQEIEEKSIYKDALVIGAGTGLGVSHLVWLEEGYRPYSSEAGHVGFAPENAQQGKLLAWMQQQYTHVSMELLLSGAGLVRIYNFLHEVAGLPESPAVIEAMHEVDPAQVITEHALLEDDDLCIKTLDLFLDIYGSAAGNAALHYYPISDVFIAGGIAAKIRSKMTDGRFIDAFINKGLMTSVLESISVKLITQEKVGLYGAISFARKISAAR